MSFSFSEIINSVFCAIIYGCGYFVYFTILRILLSRLRDVKFFIRSTYDYSKITEKKRRGDVALKPSSVTAFFDIFIFGIGFILLSYFALDGCLRVYMVIVSSFVFFSLKKLLYSRTSCVAGKLLDHIELPLLVCLRVMLLPFIWIFRKLSQNGTNYLGKFIKLKHSYDTSSIDKRNKKC